MAISLIALGVTIVHCGWGLCREADYLLIDDQLLASIWLGKYMITWPDVHTPPEVKECLVSE